MTVVIVIAVVNQGFTTVTAAFVWGGIAAIQLIQIVSMMLSPREDRARYKLGFHILIGLGSACMALAVLQARDSVKIPMTGAALVFVLVGLGLIILHRRERNVP